MDRLLGALLAAAVLLSGCGDSKVAGGTGSDFPQPMARLLDTNLQPVSARVWRLWRVQGDSTEAVLQIADSNGFRVPVSGLWIVEAWSDSVNSGPLRGLSKSRFADTNSTCSRVLTYLPGQSGTRMVGVLPCLDIAAPSLATPSRSTKPLGVGVFGASDSIRTIVSVPGASKAFRFMVWSIRWDTVKHPLPSTVTGTDSVLVSYRGKRTSLLHGTVDVGLPTGDWYFEGWAADLGDSLGLYDWTYPPATRWVDSIALRSCFGSASGDCTLHRVGPTIWYKEADAHFVVRLP